MKKRFTIEIIVDEDGMSHTNVTNDSFNAPELLGLLELKKMDIIDQCINPEKFILIRRRILDGKEYEVTKEGE